MEKDKNQDMIGEIYLYDGEEKCEVIGLFDKNTVIVKFFDGLTHSYPAKIKDLKSI